MDAVKFLKEEHRFLNSGSEESGEYMLLSPEKQVEFIETWSSLNSEKTNLALFRRIMNDNFKGLKG